MTFDRTGYVERAVGKNVVGKGNWKEREVGKF